MVGADEAVALVYSDRKSENKAMSSKHAAQHDVRTVEDSAHIDY